MTFTQDDAKALIAELGDYDSRSSSESELVQRYLRYYRLPVSTESQSYSIGNVYTEHHRIAVQSWTQENSKGTQWLVHGYLDHIGSCRHLIEWMLDEGWSVVAFDLPGHGLSSGERASIDSFDDYRDALLSCQQKLSEMPRPWVGTGHSTGASVVMTNLCSYPDEANMAAGILIAPLVRPKMWGYLQIVYPLYRLLVCKTKRVFNESTHDQEFIHFQSSKDPLQPRSIPRKWLDAMNTWYRSFKEFAPQSTPIKILQGDDDLTVDYRYNIEAIRKMFPHTEAAIIAGGRHHLFNESDEYRREVEKFIRRWL